MLEAHDLHLWRGERAVLRGLGFAIGAGECLQVQGPNGSGKSSLLRATVGLLPLEQGRVSWRGADTRSDRSAMYKELAWLGHGNGLKFELTATENLHFARVATRSRDSSGRHALLQQCGIADDAARLTRQHSAGQQRRIALARVLASEATLWVLDEPTANLDAAGQALFAAMLRSHLDAGGMALVATHHAFGAGDARIRSLELA